MIDRYAVGTEKESMSVELERQYFPKRKEHWRSFAVNFRDWGSEYSLDPCFFEGSESILNDREAGEQGGKSLVWPRLYCKNSESQLNDRE